MNDLNRLAYSNYKDSGIEWLGQIPSHWIITRLKYGIKLIESGKRNLVDYSDILSIGGEHIGNNNKLKLKNLKYISENFYKKSQKGRVQKNDILIVKDGATIGKTAYIDEPLKQKMLLNEHVYRIVAHKYIYYFILSSFFQEKIWSENNSSAQEGLNLFTIKNIPLLIPSMEEQKGIAEFLDTTVSKIDEVMEKKKRQIELLQEKRSALITHTVTKGLNPKAKMKDSGVEWLGKIPTHWTIKKLKQMGVFKKSKGGTKADETLNGVPCIRYGDLYTYHKTFIEKSRTCISIEQSYGYTPIQYGDVLFATSGETIEDIGKSAINLITEKVFCGGDIILFRNTIQANIRFIGYAMDTLQMAFQKACMGRGVTIMHIYIDQLKNLLLVIPSIKEQQIIADYLDKQTKQIDTLIEKIKKSITLLKEYRLALITSAVTGQINVQANAEVITIHQTKKQSLPIFQKAVFATEIVACMKDDPHFGRTKFMKILYLCEAHLNIPLKGEYKRKAAGPLDPSIYKIEKIMKKQKWFKAIKQGPMNTYKSLENPTGHKKYFNKHWDKYKKPLSKLLLLMRKMTTEQMEIIDTIYAVWNDFLIDGKKPSDHQIIDGVKNHWHESKKRFPDQKLQKAMNWMRQKKLVPQGYGPKTKTLEATK